MTLLVIPYMVDESLHRQPNGTSTLWYMNQCVLYSMVDDPTSPLHNGKIMTK